jgi:hypothetical protein
MYLGSGTITFINILQENQVVVTGSEQLFPGLHMLNTMSFCRVPIESTIGMIESRRKGSKYNAHILRKP